MKRIIFLFLLLPMMHVISQNGKSTLDQVLMTSRPQDIEEEIWLVLRDNRLVIADRSTIRFDTTVLSIEGTLRSLKVPVNDVKTFRSVPLRQDFRNAALATFLVASVLTLSPEGLPGSYPGRIGTTDEQFPGLTLSSLLFSVGSAVAVGFLAQSLQRDNPPVPVSDLNATAWHLLLDEQRSKFRFSSSVSLVNAISKQRWLDHHKPYGFSEQTKTLTYSSNHPETAEINLSRFLSVTYTFQPSIQIGLAYQEDGIQRFYEDVTYIVPGNPPRTIIQETYSQAGVSTIFITAQYSYAFPEFKKISIDLTGGIGMSSFDVRVRGFDPRYAEEKISVPSQAGYFGAVGVSYHFDRELSIGVQFDYTNHGTIEMPSISVRDWTGRAYRTVDPFKLDMTSTGIGVKVGLSF